MAFEFATASRIVFGVGSIREIVPAVRTFGPRVLVVTGRNPRCLGTFSGIDSVHFAVEGEPTLDAVRKGVAKARGAGCNCVCSIGGGSAIDAGKAIAALIPNSGEPLDYLEIIGKGQALEHAPLPFIAVPTTAGTGSEVTRNAVLASPEHRLKASLRSASMIPRLAIVDPELTLGLPAGVTASTGLDALTQLIEPYVSVRRNPMTDAFCLDGLKRAAHALPRVFHDGSDREARSEMALASLYGGVALANAGLGIVHGFAAPIGGMFPAPHGATCAAVLPFGMEANIRALRVRDRDGEALRRYETVARILTGDGRASAEEGAEWVWSLCRDLGIPHLRAYGIEEQHVPELVAKAAMANSTKGNAIALTEEELRDILERAI